MDFSFQNESGGTRQSTSELGSALDLRGLPLIFSSVENIAGVNARAAFTVNSAAVFPEDCDIMPSTFGNIKYMPWGADNQMPYDIIDLSFLFSMTTKVIGFWVYHLRRFVFMLVVPPG